MPESVWRIICCYMVWGTSFPLCWETNGPIHRPQVPVHTMGMEEASDHVWQMLASHNRLQRSDDDPCFLDINTSKRAISLKDCTVHACGSLTVTSYALARRHRQTFNDITHFVHKCRSLGRSCRRIFRFKVLERRLQSLILRTILLFVVSPSLVPVTFKPS